MLDNLYSCGHLHGLWRLADWCYGSPSELVVSSPSGFEVISSARGARQGCPLGTLLFSLSLQPILQHMVQGLPGVTLTAIVDDITVAGPPDKVAIALARAQQLLPALGLQLSLTKSSLFWPSHLAVPHDVSDLASSHGLPLKRHVSAPLWAATLRAFVSLCYTKSKTTSPSSRPSAFLSSLLSMRC